LYSKALKCDTTFPIQFSFVLPSNSTWKKREQPREIKFAVNMYKENSFECLLFGLDISFFGDIEVKEDDDT
jgi:hypothetical protein